MTPLFAGVSDTLVQQLTLPTSALIYAKDLFPSPVLTCETLVKILLTHHVIPRNVWYQSNDLSITQANY